MFPRRLLTLVVVDPMGIHRSMIRCFSTQLQGKSPLAVYQQNIREKKYRHDARQERTIVLLDKLWNCLMNKNDSNNTIASSPASSSASSFSNLFSFWKNDQIEDVPIHSESAVSCRGLYIYGGVGCGKTMLMDLFYDCIPPNIGLKKRRAHYHSFMLDIHQRLHKLRTSPETKHITHPLAHLARTIVAEEVNVLCLDEFQVTDVADAMILKDLVGSLFSNGCVMVATSNRRPEDLYLNGINRASFLPFIGTLKDWCDVHYMEHGIDHRLLGEVAQHVYHSPLDKNTEKAVEHLFEVLTKDSKVTKNISIDVMMGRTLTIPIGSIEKGVARFTFSQLCEQALGAADYIALATNFKYVLLTDVPIIRYDQRELLRRFITLLDVLYERRVRLLISAAAPPQSLFQPGSGSSELKIPEGVKGGKWGTHDVFGTAEDETFASSRAVSRLIEMQSLDYLNREDSS